jgi:L-lactate utilization protein LutC
MNTHDKIELPPLPKWGAIRTERGGKVELWPCQYREALDRAFLKGARAAIEAYHYPTDTQQKLNEVLEYLQNEVMKLEAAYGNNFKKEATEKARAATEKTKEAVYAINKSDRQRRGEPDGWQLVPKDPTWKMVTAGKHTIKGADTTFESILAAAAYSSMLAAAPKFGEEE